MKCACFVAGTGIDSGYSNNISNNISNDAVVIMDIEDVPEGKQEDEGENMSGILQ